MRPFGTLKGSIVGSTSSDFPHWPAPTEALLFFLLSAIGLRPVLFLAIVKPGKNVPRGDQLTGQMRVDGARMDNQSLIELRLGEILGFRFILKRLGHSRAPPFRQHTAFGNFESDEPAIRHLSPIDAAPQRSFRHPAWTPGCETSPGSTPALAVPVFFNDEQSDAGLI
jgi:hypothetical protein